MIGILQEWTGKIKRKLSKGPFGSLHFGGIEIYIMD